MKTEEQALQQLTLQQRMWLVKRELVEGGIRFWGLSPLFMSSTGLTLRFPV